MTDKAVCRTAPATPGLSKMLQSRKNNLVSVNWWFTQFCAICSVITFLAKSFYTLFILMLICFFLLYISHIILFQGIVTNPKGQISGDGAVIYSCRTAEGLPCTIPFSGSHYIPNSLHFTLELQKLFFFLFDLNEIISNIFVLRGVHENVDIKKIIGKMSTFSKCHCDILLCQLDMSKCWLYMSKGRFKMSKLWHYPQYCQRRNSGNMFCLLLFLEYHLVYSKDSFN